MAGLFQNVKDYVKPIRDFESEYKTGKFQINACELGEPDLKIRKVLNDVEKDSSSSTIICLGKIGPQDVAIKISFAVKPGKSNELETEIFIYTNMIPKMLKHTPHLLGIDQVIYCHDHWNPETALPRGIQGRNDIAEKLQDATDEIEFEFGHIYNTETAAFLITELAPGGSKTLSNYIDMPGRRSKKDFYYPVLAQIAWTLIIFGKFGVMHNDLHDGNVFIEEVNPPVRIVYTYAATKFELVTKYFVRLYDFDHASKSATKTDDTVYRNTLLDNTFCKTLGECNEYLFLWDWTTILIYIAYDTCVKNNNVEPKEWDWLQKLIPLDFLRSQVVDGIVEKKDRTNTWAHLGRTCQCKDPKCTECQPRLDILHKIPGPVKFIGSKLKRLPPDAIADYVL